MYKIYFLLLLTAANFIQAQFSWSRIHPVYTASSVPPHANIYFSAATAQHSWSLAFRQDTGQIVFSRSMDGSLTWSPVPTILQVNTNNFMVNYFQAISNNDAYFILHKPNTLYKTNNGGTNWEAKRNFTTEPILLHFWDSLNGIVVCNPDTSNSSGSKKIEIYKTADGGTTWVQKGQHNITGISLLETPINFFDANYGDSYWFFTSDGQLVKTSDKGDTWTATPTPARTAGESVLNSCGYITMKGPSSGFVAIHDTGVVYKTDNAMASWTLKGNPGLGKATYLTYIPETNYLIAVSNQGSKFSTDEGTTWTVIDNEGNSYIKSGGLNNTVAKGKNGIGEGFWEMYKLTGPGTQGNLPGTGIPQLPSESDDPFAIYPIPTDDFLYIRSKIIIRAYSIWDSAGRLVSKGTSTDNIIPVKWLPTGVYHLEILHNNDTVYRKFIKK